MSGKVDAKSPERVIRVLGTVERVNRQAVANGLGASGKIRAAKGLIQLKPIGENSWQLWVSTNKTVDGQRYDVKNVQKLRANFVNDGKLTIEMKQPPFDVMIRDCKPQDLSLLVQKIQQIRKIGMTIKPLAEPPSLNSVKAKGTTSKNAQSSSIQTRSKSQSPDVPCTSSSSSGSVPSNSLVAGGLSKWKHSTEIKRTGGSAVGVKRPLVHADMSKTEAASIRKTLRLATSVLLISQRSDYPLRGFPSDLKRLTCQNIQLRRIDSRIQDLPYLNSLSMPQNRITSIDCLINLKSTLEHLNVSDNLIESVREDLFRSKALAHLKILNLNGNQLRRLPSSILDLRELKELQVANNFVKVLPYNMHQLSSLVTLKVYGNHLKSLPSPMSLLSLNMLDISANTFKNPNDLNKLKNTVKLDTMPTLFELAGSAILTHRHRRNSAMVGSKSELNVFDCSIVPKIISDYLSLGKFCRQCGRMCLRYKISYSTSTCSFAQEFVRSTREFPVCTIHCDRCSGFYA